MTIRRRKPVPTLPADRLKELLKERNMRQIDLCSDYTSTTYRMHRSEVSELCNAVRPLTEEKAQDLIDHFFPDVRLEWLMGWSDVKTKQDEDRETLWGIALNMQKDEQQTVCLRMFMQHYGYQIEEYPEINKDMSEPELQKAVEIMLASNGVTYRIKKDGQLIKELDLPEFTRLKEKIGQVISILFEL